MKAPSLGGVWRIGYARPFVILLVVNILVFLVFTLPRTMSERQLTARSVAARQEIAERRQRADEIGRREEVVKANMADTQNFYSTLVPERKDLSVILRDLHRMAASAGVNASRVTYGKPQEVKGSRLITFEVTMPISGTYQQVGMFLQKLERAKHFIIVKSVALRGRPDEEGAADLDIRLETYFHSDEKQVRRRS